MAGAGASARPANTASTGTSKSIFAKAKAAFIGRSFRSGGWYIESYARTVASMFRDFHLTQP
jgi:hypothetical protein